MDMQEFRERGLAEMRRRGDRVANECLRAGGIFHVQHFRPRKSGSMILLGESFEKNLVVNQGINHLLNVGFNAATQVATWYIGLFEGNYTPVAGDTAATFPGSATECTAYAEANRVTYNEAASTAQSITNSASVAVFTMNATKTVYGAFLSSASAKSATTGTLAAASRFAVSRSVIDLDELRVTYTFNMTAS